MRIVRGSGNIYNDINIYVLDLTSCLDIGLAYLFPDNTIVHSQIFVRNIDRTKIKHSDIKNIYKFPFDF